MLFTRIDKSIKASNINLEYFLVFFSEMSMQTNQKVLRYESLRKITNAINFQLVETELQEVWKILDRFQHGEIPIAKLTELASDFNLHIGSLKRRQLLIYKLGKAIENAISVKNQQMMAGNPESMRAEVLNAAKLYFLNFAERPAHGQDQVYGQQGPDQAFLTDQGLYKLLTCIGITDVGVFEAGRVLVRL
jgi:hypothetical protein